MTKAQLQEHIEELESEAEDLVDALKESDNKAKEFKKRAVEAEQIADQYQECLETLQGSHLKLSKAEEIRNPDYIFSDAHAAELEFTQCAIDNDIEVDI